MLILPRQDPTNSTSTVIDDLLLDGSEEQLVQNETGVDLFLYPNNPKDCKKALFV